LNEVLPNPALNLPELLALANKHHLAGDVIGARQRYQELLEVEPNHAEAIFGIGLLEYGDGQYGAALKHVRRAISINPHDIRFHFGLAQILTDSGQYAAAEAEYQHVLSVEPRRAEVHFAVGHLREREQNWAAALEAYQVAVEIKPGYVEALNNLGNCYQRMGKLDQAADMYGKALLGRPEYADALANLGIVLAALGRTVEATDRLKQAIAQQPQVAQHYLNLGAVLCQRRAFDEAVGVLQKALTLNGNLAEAAYNLGNAQRGLGQLEEAIAQYRRAIELNPLHADAQNNLGVIYKEQGKFSLAAAAFDAAIRTDPSSAVALNNAANLHRTLGKLDDAEALLRQAISVQPNLSATYNNLANVLKDAGALSEAIDCYQKSIHLDLSNAAAHSNLIYSLYFQETDGRKILEASRQWDAQHGKSLRRNRAAMGNERRSDRRLRIGYVSGDFREHCQSLFTIPLLSSHDHQAVKAFCYSSVERQDQRTAQITGYADTWHDVRHLNDAELYSLIQNDRIDILVDLAMHMAGGRPELFARGAAPVQVAWLAYPGTTGLSAMDYVLTDPWLAPAGFDAHYSEKVIRLPETFWCYDPLSDDPQVNELPMLSKGRPTFGCLNAPCKISDHTLRLWAAVMKRIENAHLVLMAPQGRHRARLLERFAAQGISADRITMKDFVPRQTYLRNYHQIDLGLDTIPYNGHTTSLDSFWMGVPVISRIGQTAVGRAGLSQLSNLGLGNLAAATDEQYVDLAVKLATDSIRLAELRHTLRGRMQQSALMDKQRFARNIEAAYHQMWQEKFQ
jgi:predicted O-linked N-acetylglucosamine transferase (SPINDLY family)